jgi:hypothetical protein
MDNKHFYSSQYREFFLTFLNRTTQKAVTNSHMALGLKKRNYQLVNDLPFGKAANFLTFGAGSGDDFLTFLKEPSKAGKINTTFFEPNLGTAIWFVFNYLSEGFNFNRLFSVDSLKKNTYDFIAANHSLYYVPSIKQSIRRIHNSLSSGGLAFIALTSDQGPLFKLREEFFPIIHNTKPLSGEQVCKTLDSMLIPYDTHLIHSETSISPETEFSGTRHDRDIICTNQNGRNYHFCFSGCTDIERLYSFFIRENFQNLTPEIQGRFVDAVEDLAEGEWLNFVDRVIWLQKPGMFRDSHVSFNREHINRVKLKHVQGILKKQSDTILSDVSFLSPTMKESYRNIMFMNAFLSHNQFQYVVDHLDNLAGELDGDHPSGILHRPFPHDMNPKEVYLFTSHEPNLLVKEFTYASISGPGTTLGIADWFREYIILNYKTLPQQDKNNLNLGDFYALIHDLHRRFDHCMEFSINNFPVLYYNTRKHKYDPGPTLFATEKEKMFPQIYDKTFAENTLLSLRKELIKPEFIKKLEDQANLD